MIIAADSVPYRKKKREEFFLKIFFPKISTDYFFAIGHPSLKVPVLSVLDVAIDAYHLREYEVFPKTEGFVSSKHME